MIAGPDLGLTLSFGDLILIFMFVFIGALLTEKDDK
jgi:hypothetical protein